MNRDACSTELTEQTFTPERTRSVLTSACEIAGLDPSGATVLRHHTNAVYLLPGESVVVKIGRPRDTTRFAAIVEFVQWLEGHTVPTVPLHPGVVQPITLAGCPVTFWQYLEQHNAIRAQQLAVPLARLHACPLPPNDLPWFGIEDTFASITRSIDHSRILTPDDRALLRHHRDELARQAPDVTFDLLPSVIHGDAHHHNALHDPAGAAVLCDWDGAAIGPPEWDLVTLEVHNRRFSHPPTDYKQFCSLYGLDIRDWSSYPWLRDLRELRMITTNARKSAPGTAASGEVSRRIAALRSRLHTSWTIL
ncbi:phosphotransferase [Nocardia puris]|uniref:phosphotransferase family protein n=1 Tax=Nocardia puris TaxID=208602 RepID=UPI0018955BC6|nr:phosphotransferase [Nocardia puris]MBF6212187.1 phosphotransferase [Nocardia puris]